MNVRGVVSGVTGQVNPRRMGEILLSNGYTTDDEGQTLPQYYPSIWRLMQVQALTQAEKYNLMGINVQKAEYSIYIDGELSGIVRSENKGGDLVVLGDHTYLVTAVMEHWPNWTKVAAVLQLAS